MLVEKIVTIYFLLVFVVYIFLFYNNMIELSFYLTLILLYPSKFWLNRLSQAYKKDFDKELH